MLVDQSTVDAQRRWIVGRSERTVRLLNEVRDLLGRAFGVEVGAVSETQYVEEVEAVFADPDVAVNVSALVALLRDLDVLEDYPGFVVDEWLGRRLAATIAGEEPSRLLAEATFHYADVALERESNDDEPAGVDDLDAALVAGFQTRLPGWEWRETDGPFDRGV